LKYRNKKFNSLPCHLNSPYPDNVRTVNLNALFIYILVS